MGKLTPTQLFSMGGAVWHPSGTDKSSFQKSAYRISQVLGKINEKKNYYSFFFNLKTTPTPPVPLSQTGSLFLDRFGNQHFQNSSENFIPFPEEKQKGLPENSRNPFRMKDRSYLGGNSPLEKRISGEC